MAKAQEKSAPYTPRLQIYFSENDADLTALYEWIIGRWRTWRKRDGTLADSENDMARDILARARQRDLSRPGGA